MCNVLSRHAFWQLGPPAEQQQQLQDGDAPLCKALAAQLPLYADRAGATAAAAAAAWMRLPPLPAGGLARRLLLAAASAGGSPPTRALAIFAAEGDNRADALAMARLVRALLAGAGTPGAQTQREEGSAPDEEAAAVAAANVPRIVPPRDWQLVFGGPFSEGLF